ncbi:KRAB-A domain-containing protein 2-like isoform X2 [Corticium candelabrum]|uniref:KRAB-A domain-containing protein 2-like isoform X2 n=1 Tax=Corticium candelabrum TaxID=121492 RepID=UPI002E25BD72|nr:KRAB-A domain-containing protein 2-like isoform X2 [Corticium candelabrum]
MGSETKTSLLGNWLKVANVSEIYDILITIHEGSRVHAGYRKVFADVQKQYFGIPRPAVQQFVKTCVICACKTPQMSVATVKAIISPGFMRRGQIDLIDMTVDPDGDFKYIGHYVDHFTKFNFLWPQHRKKSVEVARCLIKNVFSVVGLPLILQHDNGKEFCNKIIRKVVRLWPGDCKIVTGRPRHPQSQGLVEQAHRTVQHMLAVRRAEYPGTGWTKYLSLVQYAMNTQIHSAINVAPYDVVFGQPPTDGVFPGCHKDVQPEEEDLLKVLKDIPTLTDEYGNDSPDEGDGHVEDHTVSTSERACQFVNSTISSLPDNHNDKDNDGIETLLEDIPTLDKHDGNDSSDKGDEDDVEMARVCRDIL